MQTISTQHVDEPARFDFWVSEIDRIMPMSLDTRPGVTRSFHGRASVHELGPMQLSRLSAGPMRVRHSRPTDDGSDCYKLMLQLAGEARVDHAGATRRLAAGNLVLCDTSRPYTLTYDDDFLAAVVLLPRPTIHLPAPSLQPLIGRPLTADSITGAAVASLVRSLTEDDRGDVGDPAAARLVDGTLSLVTALLLEEIEAAGPPSGPAMLLRAREHVERHLADPRLAPDTLASALGISRRYLFKVFAEEGTTVAGWIRDRRLERCARDLADPALAGQPIALVGARWGLGDPRHLARVFRARYGCTPTEYRRGVR
ncbi:MAG: helix-turn-helix domain-containing protein [Nocardioides alkalitolerans]